MATKHIFDINSIVLIEFFKERITDSYSWSDAKMSKPFFGKPKKKYDSGFYNYHDYNNHDCFTADDIIKKGYKVIGNDVYAKSYVVIKLKHDHTISTEFESENEAEKWIDDIIKKTDKIFEIIKHD